MFVTYTAMLMKWAKIQTKPSVTGIDTNANANGTAIAPSVPNMNAITARAMGIAIASPRARSSLKTFFVSSASAGKPLRYVFVSGTSPIARRMAFVWLAASMPSRLVVIWIYATWREARSTSPALPFGNLRAARTAAAFAVARNEPLLASPFVSSTSVNAPSLRSPKFALRMSRPRSASEPGTLKRFESRCPTSAAPAPPSTNRTSHAAITLRRLRMMKPVQAITSGSLE
jgi:hypothetical protein